MAIQPKNETDIKVDAIDEKTSDSGVTVEGVLIKDSEVSVDTINEATGGSGVTVDGVLLKDGAATFSSLTATTLNTTTTNATDVDTTNVDASGTVTAGTVSTDTISEETGGAGVTVDGVLLKDSDVQAVEVRTNTISERTGSSGVTVDGVLLKDSTVEVDNITEKTLSAGVTIEGLKLEDGNITASSGNITVSDHIEPTSNNTYSCGRPSSQWLQVYTSSVEASGNMNLSCNGSSQMILFDGNLRATSASAVDFGTSGTPYGTMYAGAFTVPSDQRIKENVTPLLSGEALTKISKLRPVSFNKIEPYGNPDETIPGFLAQELATEIPEAVREGDGNSELSYDEEGFEMWCVENNHIIPFLVGAIQELKAKCEQLEERVEQLEA